MLKLLKILFNLDYITVYTKRGIWEINDYSFGEPPMTNKKSCIYKIQYSKIRDKYRLITSGYKTKEHKLYSFMLDIMNNYTLKDHEKT